MTQCLRLFSVGCNINDSASSDSAVQIGQLDERLAEVAKQKNDEIEQYLARCKKSERKLVKVLLLGATASGKSTFMKQMRIIYKDGYKRVEELQYFTDLITANIYWAFRQLVCGCVALSIDTTSIDELIVELMRRFGSYNVKETPGIRISRSTAQLLHAFWISEPVQKAYRKRYMFELIDSTNYFLNRLERISAPDFIADESDILHCRVPATATVGTSFRYGDVNLSFLNRLERISAPDFIADESDILHCRVPATATVGTSFRYGDVNLRIINIGGQKSQCRKWMHLFDDVRVVLFIVDLTAYARKCVDDKTRQELHGVLKQFREVARSNTLWRAFMLLFFNKADLFVELLDLVPLSDCFPRYSGQKSQCRKWMHLFDDVRVVLFIVDLTAYARKCVDDKTRQELHGVLKQFREVARSNTLWRAFMLLFFNKADLFVELLDLVPLSDCFPRYSGESSVATCRECVRSVFMKAAEPRSSIVTHFTIATRTNNIGFAFSSCMDLVLKHALSGRSLL
ncbi:Guanine nucleotide-binding proteinalpha-14 subunit [Toxocara canis]|uniref:Guanine nucleotide-binding proteinalpha-14 subunit n=1 Tax=Toxocara canis TaxID=6265 RepID=A0A0B2V5B2_TOXCA|nr:Guanine nucleotide-binding proteinalpha-14 subunit [Toxocara canis]